MNKSQYMKELSKRLKKIPKEDREDALTYYEEYFLEMGIADGEDVSGRIESPETIAGDILTDCTRKRIERQRADGGVKNSAMVIWLIFLGICALPVALPLLVVVLVFLLCMVVFAVCIFLAFAGVDIGLGAMGIAAFLGVVWAKGIGQKLVCVGMGLCGIALGILGAVLTVLVCRWLVRMLVRLFQGVHGFVLKKKG